MRVSSPSTLRSVLRTGACALALLSCSGAAVAQQAATTAKIAGGYTPVEPIPVDDPATPSVTAALFLPQGTGPFPAVIVLSGCAGLGPDVSVVERVNSEYLPKGIATLVVDSFTPRGVEGVCSAANPIESVLYRARDAQAARAWLARRPDIDAKRIFLQGYSHGAMAAIAAINSARPGYTDPGVAGVIAFYPFCNQQAKFSVPTVILIGAKDDWTPAAMCQGIVDKTNVELNVYPDATHGFAAPGMDTTFLGHRLVYDEAATNDGLARALKLIRATGQ